MWLESKKRSKKLCEESVALLPSSAVENLVQQKCGGVVMSGSSLLPSSTTLFPAIWERQAPAHLVLHQLRKEAFTICFLVSKIDGINNEHGHSEIK